MGMTHIVVEGKVWWVRPRMRCRHKAHLGRASALFECFAEVRRLFYVNLVVCVALDGWADNGRVGDDSAWADMLGVGAFSALGHNCDLAACHAFCQSVSSEKGVSSLPSLMYDCVVSVSGSLKRGFDKDASIKR